MAKTKPKGTAAVRTPLQMAREQLLIARGVTKADIARAADRHRQTVSAVFRDKARSERVESIAAKMLGVPVRFLAFSTPPKTDPPPELIAAIHHNEYLNDWKGKNGSKS